MLFRGVVVGAASGALGALVASHNAGGQYMRARTVPTNPASSFQNEVRDAVRTLSNRWAVVLDDDQRASWNIYATNVTKTNRLGDSTHISGFNWYVANNVPRLQAGLIVADDGPVDYNTGQPAYNGVLFFSEGTDGTINFGETTLPISTDTNSALLVYVGRPFSRGRNFFKGPYRFAVAIPGNNTVSEVAFTLPFDRGSTMNFMDATLSFTRGDGRLATGFRKSSQNS